MDNKRKIINVIGAIFILSLMSFSMFIVSEYLLSLVLMDEKIIFSSSVFMTFFSFSFSFSLISYAAFFIVFVTVTGHYPKNHDSFVKYFFSIAIIAVF